MPDNDDPFFNLDEEKTIIKPSPGGRRPAAPASRPEPRPEPGGHVQLSERRGLNPLERAAAMLLNLLSQIRNTSSHPNPNGLHQQLATEIKKFEQAAQKEGISPETIYMARYALCSTIDEFVMSTPWGVGSIWSQQSLLSLFHKETRGGEKFFRLLEKLKQDPARNIDMLELLYLCLALGFQGRYRVSQNGLSELEQIREDLYYTIRNQRGEFEPGLSLHWEGIDRNATGRSHLVPGWMAACIVILLLVGLFSLWRFNLGAHADPVQAELVNIGREENLLPNRIMAAAPANTGIIKDTEPPRFGLRQFLAPEIQQNQVNVQELPDRIVVTINGDGLFESGSEVVKDGYRPILDRIAEGLNQTTGRIQVMGHTDNIPMRRSGRYASNFELSQARAESVVRLLSQKVKQANRMVAEGLGDTQPIASNDSPQGRAQNRRVEITVMERARGI